MTVQPAFFASLRRLAIAGVAPFQRLTPAQIERLARPMRVHEADAEAAALATLLGEPALGITTALALGRGNFGLLEFLVRSAPTWLQSMQRAVRYSALINPLLVFEVRAERDAVDFVERLPGRAEAMGRHINEFSIVTFHLLTAQSIGAVQFLDVRLAHADETSLAPLEALIGRRPRFGAGENCMRIGLRDAQRTPAAADAALFRFLEAEATQRLPTPGRRSLTHIVENTLRQGFLDAQVGIEAVSASLHMSRRTLQRRLAEEDTTFERVLDGLRRRIANEATARGGVSPAEISFMLGYADPRALHRAMKRWKRG